MMAGYAVEVRWACGDTFRCSRVEWVGRNANGIGRGRWRYTAEDLPCKTVPLKVCTHKDSMTVILCTDA